VCELLLAVWPEPEPFERVLPWGLELERLGIGGFGWGVAWREAGRVRRYRDPGTLLADKSGQAELLGVHSTHFLLHLRRPSQLSTITLADTQPFVTDDGSFAFAHNGRLERAPEFRDRFASQLQGRADSEVGFRLFEVLIAAGRRPAEALREVHQQLAGSANLAYLPAQGTPLFYGGNPGNDSWRFLLDGAAVASTALHSADEALLSLCFPSARRAVRLSPGEVAAVGLDQASLPTASGIEV